MFEGGNNNKRYGVLFFFVVAFVTFAFLRNSITLPKFLDNYSSMVTLEERGLNLTTTSFSKTSCRRHHWSNKSGSMRSNLLKDDYNYCVKITPFMGPIKFIYKSKNPCWLQNGIMHCIPRFYLAGFPKCGSSDLYFRINQHPQIVGLKKEFHWLDYKRYFEGADTIDVYSDMMKPFPKVVSKEIGMQGYSKRIAGDFTPSTAWGSFYWRCFEGNEGLLTPRYTLADVVYRLNTRTKVILSLRNPTDRLYSRFLNWAGYGKGGKAYVNASPQSFHDLVSKAVTLYKECFRYLSPRQCAYNGTMYTLARIKIHEGMYSIFVKDWLKVFPRDQVLIFRFEDYIQDIAGHLQRIYHFLDVDPLPGKQTQEIARKPIINKGRNYKTIGPMLNRTRELLDSFYRPFITNIDLLAKDRKLVW